MACMAWTWDAEQGEVSLQLKALVGAEGRITGLDLNSTYIEIAKQKAAQKHIAGVVFCQQDVLDWFQKNKNAVNQSEEKPFYDFFYSRLFLRHLHKPKEAPGPHV